MSNYTETDSGNAQALFDYAQGTHAYLSDQGAWIYYDGKRWQKDESQLQICQAASVVVEDFASDQWRKHCQSLRVQQAMIQMSRPLFKAHSSELDQDPDLLCVGNGYINLRNGELRPHDPIMMMSKMTDIDYDPSAECPLWLTFLARVLPDPEVRAYLQRLVGYTLTGFTTEQLLVFFEGGGANGKSVGMETLISLLGDYAVKAPDTLIVQGGDKHPTAMARLRGARLATLSELEKGAKLKEGQVKVMTGGDKLTARQMGENYFDFVPTHTFWMMSNHRPEIAGTDEGIWRRINIIEFNETITADERDPDLVVKLRNELPGILAWAVEGAKQWFNAGQSVRPVPEAVAMSNTVYRDAQDALGSFIDEFYETSVLDGVFSVKASEIQGHFADWCSRNGYAKWSPPDFKQEMERRGYKSTRQSSGNVYRNIAKRQEAYA